jgi:hypothetical protein
VGGCSPRKWGADDRLTVLPSLGRGWHIGAHLAGAAKPAGGLGHAGVGAGLPRRQFRPGEKGTGLRWTQVGKGLQVMIVADGQGVPIGLQVVSAHPH